MTQDNDSTPQSGQTPETFPEPAKKPRSTAKKAAIPKSATAKAASTKAPAAKAPASKARAATKNATEDSGTPPPAAGSKTTAKTAGKTASAKTATAKGAAAETSAEPRRGAKTKAGPAKDAAPETAPRAPSVAAPQPTKASGKTSGTGKNASAAKRAATPFSHDAKAKTEPAQAASANDNAPSAQPAPPAETTLSGETAASSATPAATPAPKKRQTRSSRTKASAQKTERPEKSGTAELAEPGGAPLEAVRPKTLPEESASPEVQSAPQEQNRTGETVEPSAKPASRRSRRGGRRRNKSRANGNGAENAAPQAQTPPATPSPAMESRETQEADTVESRAKNAAGKDSGKNARKADVKSGGKNARADEAAHPAEGAGKPGSKRKMFISVLSGELVEVVLAEEGHVVEYYVEMQHQAKVKGNIYKGVVSNIDANLQAAFISYACGVKNGFLQIDEVHPEYYLAHHDPLKGRKYPPIQKVLKPGQEILVQVVKEPAGTKGAFLTSYLSLPGRFLVLTPGREQIGVSRKVDNDEERSRLRAMLEGLKPGAGLGVIVRTVSNGASKTSLQRDLQFLKRLWKEVRAKGQISSASSLIYEELDLSTRAVRDYLTDDVQEVWVDDENTAAQVTELANLLFPKKDKLVQVHHEPGQSLFERFSLQKQLDQIHSREVALPSGGSLVIDKTEALTAIDINSGRSSGKSNFEDMAYRTNMEAAKAIPLQLRLRDIGGQIVADFIEMRDRGHWRDVEKVVRAGMKGDRARYDVGKIGPFGMLEIVRQRLGSSAISISTEPCPCCKGMGIRRNMEWQSMQCLREIARKLRQAAVNNQTTLTYLAEPELAFYLLNTKRAILQSMETEIGVALVISPKTE